MSDHRFPSDEIMLPWLIESRAEAHPDRVFAYFEDGGTWTYSELRDIANRTANAMALLGVRQGDRVISWLPSGRDALRTWFGASKLGAVYVPVNTAYKGSLLGSVLAGADAHLIVVHHGLLPRLDDLDPGDLPKVVVSTGEPNQAVVVPYLSNEALDGNTGRPPSLERPIQLWDTQSIVYTSGTTGPSKGVLSSHIQRYETVYQFRRELDSTDRFLVDCPLFHIAGTMPVYTMLLLGGSIVMTSGFRSAGYWDIIRSGGVTAAVMVGVMAAFLENQPAASNDRENPLRYVLSVPLMENVRRFSNRFGVDVHTNYNMTETSLPILSEANPNRPAGYCGTVRPGIEARVVDEFDRELPSGEVGELILRADLPWSMNSGYDKLPDATMRAWRNGWFHTGDAVRRDAEGAFFFVDRLKDAIRRRGENISSFEVEVEVGSHPCVREAAAVGLANPDGDEDVMVVVSLAPGASLTPEDLFDYLEPRMAHFMLPRYLRIVEDLPKTPTSKVQKHLLRATGATEGTWDREKSGRSVRREQLS